MDLASRAGARLGPVLLDIAQNGLPQVSIETAAAYKHLGDLADGLVRVTARATDFAATLVSDVATSISQIGDLAARNLKIFSAFLTSTDRGRALMLRIAGADVGVGGPQGLGDILKASEKAQPGATPTLPINPEVLKKQSEALASVQVQIQTMKVAALELAQLKAT